MVAPIALSLDDWEKKILNNFHNEFLGDDQEPGIQVPEEDLEAIFHSWFWVCKLRQDIEGLFEDSHRRPHSDPLTVWNLLYRRLSHSESGYVCYSRPSKVLRDNPVFEREFTSIKPAGVTDGDLPITRIPHEDDNSAWSIALRAMQCLPSHWRGLAPGEDLPERFGCYFLRNDFSEEEIEHRQDMPLFVLRVDDTVPAYEAESSAAATRNQPTTNADSDVFDIDTLLREVLENMSDDNDEAAPSAAISHPPGVPQSLSQSRADTRMFLEQIKTKLVTDDEAPTPELAFERLLNKLSSPSLPLADRHHPHEESQHGRDSSPSEAASYSYAQFEVWSLTRMAAKVCRRRQRQLRQIPSGQDLEPLISITFPRSFEDPRRWLEYIPLDEMTVSSSPISPGSKLLWRPEKRLLLEHHLFTEEEVFKYCIENEFEFPAHKHENAIVFLASELCGSPIYPRWSGLSEINNLQSLWNDCAVTVNPADGTWYLLETIPGRDFRRITSEFGIDAARAYFRQIIDRQRLSSAISLQDLFRDTYDASNRSRLDVFEGLVDVINYEEITSWNTEPLGGQSGGVFRAQWSCPRKIDMPSEQKFQVVLKRVWPPKSDEASQRSEMKLFQELELTLQASVRRLPTLTGLYGLTRIPSHHALATANALGNEFDHDHIFFVFECAEKSLMQDLPGMLQNGNRWDIIAHLFEDLAESIATIHERGIVHRDIHPENIMIREEIYFHSPTALSGNRLVVIDLGESRTEESLTQQQSENPYGDADFRAPESEAGKYSRASDMCSIGLVMMKVLALDLGKHGLVPKPFLDAAHICLEDEPAKRPKARELSDKLNEINATRTHLQESGVAIISFEQEDFVKCCLPDGSRA